MWHALGGRRRARAKQGGCEGLQNCPGTDASSMDRDESADSVWTAFSEVIGRGIVSAASPQRGPVSDFRIARLIFVSEPSLGAIPVVLTCDISHTQPFPTEFARAP